MNECKGMNCGATDGVSHSLECHAEHAAAIAGGVFTKNTAQPAAPSVDAAMKRALMKSVKFIDAAPSVAPEPLGWAQIGLLNGQHYLRQVYDRTPYPPPADIARNLNLVPVFAHPPRASLTPEQVFANTDIMACNAKMALRMDVLMEIIRAVEAAHGISAAAIGADSGRGKA